MKSRDTAVVVGLVLAGAMFGACHKDRKKYQAPAVVDVGEGDKSEQKESLDALDKQNTDTIEKIKETEEKVETALTEAEKAAADRLTQLNLKEDAMVISLGLVNTLTKELALNMAKLDEYAAAIQAQELKEESCETKSGAPCPAEEQNTAYLEAAAKKVNSLINGVLKPKLASAKSSLATQHREYTALLASGSDSRPAKKISQDQMNQILAIISAQ